MKPETSHVSFGKKVAYAMPAFALALVGIPVYIYIPKFYTDTIGLNIGVVGSVLLFIRLLDAVTDPVVGFVSDQTSSRWGRRRPYMAVGAFFLAISIVFVFNPPQLPEFQATLWLILSMIALFLFWTLIAVPYESLGPEITFDYHARTSLFAMRDGSLIAGTIAAAAMPVLLKWILGQTAEGSDESNVFFWMSVVYAPLIILCTFICITAIKEAPSKQESGKADISANTYRVMENKPFVILLAAYTLSAFGGQLPATLILYYVQYVLESSRAELFLLIYLGTGIVFLPFWIWLSKKIEKKQAWIIALIINTGAFFGVFWLGSGDEVIYALLITLSGVGFGAGLALPSAIQADVIDYDELLSGKRREGRYVGIWSIAKKLSAAAGIGLGLWGLGMSGYQPNVAQNEQVLLMLRILYALVPCICNIAALWLIFYYPITQSVHACIRAELKRGTGKSCLHKV